MNHQPFEEWLLEDAALTVPQERELQLHLRACTVCAGIAASNLALHSGHMAAAPAGFADRFRPRLAAWHREQLRKQALGTIVLVFSGLALLYAVAGPAMLTAARSPAAWLRDVTALLVSLVTIASVAGQVGGTLLAGLAGMMPPSAWLAMLAAGTGAGILWTTVMRRLARAPRGV